MDYIHFFGTTGNKDIFFKNIRVIITHFNKNILSENPPEIAKELTKKYEIEVVAAEDDMKLYV